MVCACCANVVSAGKNQDPSLRSDDSCAIGQIAVVQVYFLSFGFKSSDAEFMQ